MLLQIRVDWQTTKVVFVSDFNKNYGLNVVNIECNAEI